MFKIDSNKNIYLTQGDTAGFIIRPSGITFEGGEIGLFTITNSKGAQMMQRIYPIADGIITVRLENDDTDHWPDGNYKWEMRYFINPEYDDQEHLIGGEEVYTPEQFDNMRNLYLKKALGNV